MRIGILIYSYPKRESFTGVARLEEAGVARGHEIVRLYEPYFTFHHDANGLRILYEGRPLGSFDVLIARPNFTEEPSLHTFTGDLLTRAGYRLINHRAGTSLSKNKLAEHVRLTERGLPMPRFDIAHTTERALESAHALGFPVIAKVAFGTHGKGVFFAPTPETLSPILDYLAVRDGNPVILEEFIAEAERKDLRVFVVGGSIVAAMERTAAPGDVRANAAQGGTGAKTVLSPEEERLALAAADTFELDIAGVDLIRSARGPLVLEVNANPGFTELEAATGVDVAGAIIDFATH